MVFREIITIVNDMASPKAKVFNAKVNTNPTASLLWFKPCLGSAFGTWKVCYPLGCQTQIVDDMHTQTH